jgi:uncharacterized membrane protein HdeD (DUF308 family)
MKGWLAMSIDTELTHGRPAITQIVTHELEHLSSYWLWFLLLGLLLVVAGGAAIVVPAATVGTTFVVTILFGVLLMVSGVATIVGSFWIGKWSGFLIQLLVGILYVACGVIMTERPGITVVTLTVFIAVSFVVMGIFRAVSALVLRFPNWGWVLLNGVVTFLAGVIIYRQLPFDALWVIGLLVGLELLFNGWTWIMLSMTLRAVARKAA